MTNCHTAKSCAETSVYLSCRKSLILAAVLHLLQTFQQQNICMPGNQGNAALLLTRCLRQTLPVGTMCIDYNTASPSSWKLE